PLADQPGAGEAHDDEDRGAEKDEADAQRDPPPEDQLEVALVRDAVAALPPEARDLERQADQPDEREPEHRQQHPGADRAGGGVADEALAEPGVDEEDEDRRRGREQLVDAKEGLVVIASAQEAGAEEVAGPQTSDVQTVRHLRRVPEEKRRRGPAPGEHR